MVDIEAFLKKREGEGLLRTLVPVERRPGSKVVVDGREYIDFSSNDYLGLSFHPKIIAAAKDALEKYGASSSASRLMSGSLSLHHALEEKTAAFKGKEAALVFNSGYQANTGMIPALVGRGDCVFSDRFNHASLLDGILLSGAECFRFRHHDAAHLRDLLGKERRRFRKALIVTETVFSMDGDIAPLADFVVLKKEFDCALFADEAHATGLFGDGGSGVVEQEGLADDVDIVMGTFGKALGGFGAYVAASRKVIDYLVNACRSFIYSTALPPSVIASNLAALDVVKDEPHRRRALLEAAAAFRRLLAEAGLEVRGQTQIVSLVIGAPGETVDAATRLKEKGYWVLAVRPPTVPKGGSRLRFSISFHHDKALLRGLSDDLREVLAPAACRRA